MMYLKSHPCKRDVRTKLTIPFNFSKSLNQLLSLSIIATYLTKHKTKDMDFITDDIRYIGCNDKELKLFESQYVLPDGMCYNSYVILDEKVAIMDTSDGRTMGEWLDNLEKALLSRRYSRIKNLGTIYLLTSFDSASCLSLKILLIIFD